MTERIAHPIRILVFLVQKYFYPNAVGLSKVMRGRSIAVAIPQGNLLHHLVSKLAIIAAKVFRK
jgi:hypothetical protein